jgi:hypothetical protein
MDTLRLTPDHPLYPKLTTLPTNGATLPLAAAQAPFADRVQLALIPFFASYLGPVASERVKSEIAERGRPNDLVSALALGFALITQIPDPATRDEAREGLDALLRSLKVSSVIPPPISSRATR